MDRENSLFLLWPEWGSNPIPSDPQSASNRLRHRPGLKLKVGEGEDCYPGLALLGNTRTVYYFHVNAYIYKRTMFLFLSERLLKTAISLAIVSADEWSSEGDKGGGVGG
jgi:hypothetical protein